MYSARLVLPTTFKLISKKFGTLPTIVAWLAEFVHRPASYDGLARHFRLYRVPFAGAFLSLDDGAKSFVCYIERVE